MLEVAAQNRSSLETHIFRRKSYNKWNEISTSPLQPKDSNHWHVQRHW